MVWIKLGSIKIFNDKLSALSAKKFNVIKIQKMRIEQPIKVPKQAVSLIAKDELIRLINLSHSNTRRYDIIDRKGINTIFKEIGLAIISLPSSKKLIIEIEQKAIKSKYDFGFSIWLDIVFNIIYFSHLN